VIRLSLRDNWATCRSDIQTWMFSEAVAVPKTVTCVKLPKSFGAYPSDRGVSGLGDSSARALWKGFRFKLNKSIERIKVEVESDGD
jgi:hypothetical protein